MTQTDELIQQAEQLPVAEKWRLVKQLLRSLEQEKVPESAQGDWHQFLRETYGSLQDTPIQRWDEGDYEDREPLE